MCARDTKRVVADLGTLSHDSQNAESWGLLGSLCGEGREEGSEGSGIDGVGSRAFLVCHRAIGKLDLFKR